MLAVNYDLDQERCKLAGQCREADYYEGNADAVFGYKPQYLKDEYLQGWWAGFKEELERHPRDRQGRIQYAPTRTTPDPYQMLWDAGAIARKEWGLPELSPDAEF